MPSAKLDLCYALWRLLKFCMWGDWRHKNVLVDGSDDVGSSTSAASSLRTTEEAAENNEI
jgi:hypothetical protein